MQSRVSDHPPRRFNDANSRSDEMTKGGAVKEQKESDQFGRAPILEEICRAPSVADVSAKTAAGRE